MTGPEDVDDETREQTDVRPPAIRASKSTPKQKGGVAQPAARAGAAGATARNVARANKAKTVAETLTDISKSAPGAGAARSDWLRSEAAKTIKSVGPAGKTGARGRLKGHLFEDLDITAYNCRGARAGKEMVKRANPRNAAYDASKFKDGQFIGAVQHKSSPAGVEAAVAKMEAVKPGAAKRGTIRVPGDQATETARRAGNRARVQGSSVTSEQLENTLDTGLAGLAAKGGKGASVYREVALGTAKSAAIGAAIGGALEVPALVRGQVSTREFAENRAVDGGEAAIATAVGSVAAGAVLGTSLGASTAASAGGACAAAAASSATAVGGMGTVGGAAATALGGVTAASAGPIVVGGVVVLGTGYLVGQGFKLARRWVRDKQEGRRLEEHDDIERTLANLEESDIEAVLVLRGSREFDEGEFVLIREDLCLLAVTTDCDERAKMTARLRRRGFYLSDWAASGAPFGGAEFDALTAGGLIIGADRTAP